MTSGSLFFKRIGNDLKHKLWMGAVVFLILFLSLPVYSSLLVEDLEMNNYMEYPTNRIISYLTVDFRLFSVTIGLAVFIALTQFSYLLSKISSDAMHSLPVKREELYAAKYLGGAAVYIAGLLINVILCAVLFTVKPHICTEVFHALFTGAGYCLAGFILVYTSVILAVLLCGQMFAGICMTILFLGYAPLAVSVIGELKSNFFLTYESVSASERTVLSWFSPASVFYYLVVDVRKGILARGWVLFLLLLVTIVLIVLSVWCYKKRPLENTTKALVFPVTGKILKFAVTVLTAFVTGIIFNNMSSSSVRISGWFYFGMIFGFLLSSCVIEIILASEFKKAFAHMGVTIVSAAVTVFLLLSISCDIFGYDRFVPKEAQFESAAVYIPDVTGMTGQNYDMTKDGYKYQSNRSYIFSNMTITDYKLLKSIAEAGNKLTRVNDNGERYQNRHTITVRYRLKTGREVVRGYNITYDQSKDLIQQLYASEEYRQGASFLCKADSNAFTGELWVQTPLDSVPLNLSENEKEELLAALKKDYDSLRAEDYADTEPFVTLSLEIISMEEYDSLTIYLYPGCTQTIQFLREKGIDLSVNNAADQIDKIDIYKVYSETAEQIDYPEEYYRKEGMYFLAETITGKEKIKEILPTLIYEGYLYQNDFFKESRAFPIQARVYLYNQGDYCMFYQIP